MPRCVNTKSALVALPLRFCLLAAALLCLVPSASAVDNTWIGGSGQWDDAANWSAGEQPQHLDDVYLTQSDATDRTVTYYDTTNPQVMLGMLTIDATGAGTMTLDMSNAHTLNVPVEYGGYYHGEGAIYVGYSGQGAMAVRNGAQVLSGKGYIGYNSGSLGAVTVTGAGSSWTNARDLYVGYSGSGTLTVADGGQVTTATVYASLGDLRGNGTITAQGAVLDDDLVFDAAHGAVQTISFGTGGSLNLSVTSYYDVAALGAGYKGAGTLRIADGVTVESAYGYLGYHSGSTGTATVTGAGSKWSTLAVYVGNNGNGTLNIQAGARVSSYSSYLGHNSGSTGTVTVTGAGSTWTNDYGLNVGLFGNGELNVEAGGQVSSSRVSFLGYLSGSTGTATVTGAGSTWTSSGDFFVGYAGNGTLNIEAGGQVSSSPGAGIGERSGSTGTVTVTGAGSTWTNFALGVGGSGNGTLNIQAGGRVSTSWSAGLGYFSGSTGTVTVTGAGSTWTNSGGLYVGKEGSATLTVADGGLVTAGTLYASLADLLGDGTITVTQGAVLDAALVFDATHGTTQTLPFGAGGTLNLTFTSAGDLGVGYRGTGTLRIADGVTVASATGYLGYNPGSTGTATVTGAGSAWANSGDFFVGYGANGTLNIEAGGRVSDTRGFFGGTATVTVRGTGSTWTSSEYLRVNGTVNVEAGGQVSNTDGYLGDSSGSTAAATVTGTGSTWTNSGALYVGYEGSGTLTVADGGRVTAATLYAAPGDLRGNGTIAAQGAVLDGDLIFDAAHGTTQAIPFGTGGTLNLSVTSAGNLGAGYKGTGTLRIADGVTVTSACGYLGDRSGSTGTATVTGAGSTWTNSEDLYVGNEGTGTLNVEAGGHVNGTTGYVGGNWGPSGKATVTGAGSTWTNSGTLYVGGYSNGTLNIEAGGRVSDAYGCVGWFSDSTGTATVDGSGSLWNNTVSLDVGYTYAGAASVTVQNGGQLTVGGTLRLWKSKSTVTVTVSGGTLTAGAIANAGALTVQAGGNLTVAGDLENGGAGYAGYEGSGTLTVADGGHVTAATLYATPSGLLGNGTIAAHGAVLDGDLVFDAAHGATQAVPFGTGGALNLSVTPAGNLGAGYKKTGTLRIAEGVTVTSATGYLGYDFNSTGTATVTGAGSAWANTATLYVGYYGHGTLNIEAGGQVSDTTGYVGGNWSVTGAATVDGSGSLWNNTAALYVGGSESKAGGAGSVTVQNGGKLTVGGTLRLWTSDYPTTATVTVTGGTLTAAAIVNDGALTVQAGGDMTVTGDVANGGILTVNDAMLSAATITNTGTIRGRGDINGAITNNAGGIVAPGASPGVLTVETITFADGSTLQIELGGPARGTEYDVLAASGAIAFQGDCALTLSLINGFVPQGGDEFDILDFAGASGHFNVLNLPQLGGGLSWDTSDLYTGGTIVVAPEPATVAMVVVGVAAVVVRRRRR